MTKVAILVDGAFYIRRARRCFPSSQVATGEDLANQLYAMCQKHLTFKKENTYAHNDLYRIYVYDADPLSKSIRYPISKEDRHLKLTEVFKERTEFFQSLTRMRKVALRKGELDENVNWILRPDSLKRLLQGKMTWDQMTDDDFAYDTRQKQVDMKMGLDIATLSLKRLVDQIVLVTGDSDFVPAAKFARREGIDFVLDPMWHKIKPDLAEHVDGIQSFCPKPSAG